MGRIPSMCACMGTSEKGKRRPPDREMATPTQGIPRSLRSGQWGEFSCHYYRYKSPTPLIPFTLP